MSGVAQATVPPSVGARAAALAVTGLELGYGDLGHSDAVVAEAAFDLAPGERLAVVGRSGCGKSTLLHALAGLVAPWSGEVRVDGRAVAAAGPAEAGHAATGPGHAAYMFQQDLLLPWLSALDNAALAARLGRDAQGRRTAGPELRERAAALLGEFGLGDRLAALPAELSGGMRQRVALARTLVPGRGLVLLDEPFGSLDTLTRAEMHLWLLEAMAAHPATWVLVTHDVNEAVLLADRVAVLGGSSARLSDVVEVPLSLAARRAAARAAAGRAVPAADPADADPEAAVRVPAARVRALLSAWEAA